MVFESLSQRFHSGKTWLVDSHKLQIVEVSSLPLFLPIHVVTVGDQSTFAPPWNYEAVKSDSLFKVEIDIDKFLAMLKKSLARNPAILILT